MLQQDESDEMLSRGFKDQIYDIYRYLPPVLQVCLISATLPHEILEMTNKFMTDPIRILVKRDELTLEGIKQFFDTLEREEWITQAVIFCNTKRKGVAIKFVKRDDIKILRDIKQYYSIQIVQNAYKCC
ncbi:uncharacterized protein LOC142625153 [Castanea sativa]|uniref:uncharacterized protein LOC142625153 n=1 Tax=Castanea sativa TaxID=21020 RepID=UPI003F653580